MLSPGSRNHGSIRCNCRLSLKLVWRVAAESFSSDSSITAHLAVHRTLPPIAYPGFAINPGQIVWPFMAHNGHKADAEIGLRYDRFVLTPATRPAIESTLIWSIIVKVI